MTVSRSSTAHTRLLTNLAKDTVLGNLVQEKWIPVAKALFEKIPIDLEQLISCGRVVINPIYDLKKSDGYFASCTFRLTLFTSKKICISNARIFRSIPLMTRNQAHWSRDVDMSIFKPLQTPPEVVTIKTHYRPEHPSYAKSRSSPDNDKNISIYKMEKEKWKGAIRPQNLSELKSAVSPPQSLKHSN